MNIASECLGDGIEGEPLGAGGKVRGRGQD